MYCTYTLFSLKDRKTYTGHTDNLRKRFKEHQQGEVRATRNRRPLRLIYFEEFPTRALAIKREKFLKSTRGRKELKKILKNRIV